MHGIPYALKDIVDVAGLPTTCHSKILAGHVAPSDAAVVNRLRDSGAVLLGKTALHEFATGGPALDLPWPPALNPWDLARHPGGSSSGSAAALAAGFVPAAVGTDTGGSVRNPATCCGLVGLKPTRALVAERGVFPLSPTLDHLGPMTRTVEDNALFLQALAGGAAFHSKMQAGIRGLRIGVVEHFHAEEDGVDAQMVDAFEEAVRRLAAMGAAVRTVRLPPLAEWVACGRVIQQFEQYAVHEKWLRNRPADYCALSRAKLSAGAGLSRTDYEAALKEQARLGAALDLAMREVDALVALSGFHLPCRIDDADEIARTYAHHARMPFNVSGTPAIAVPTGFSTEGLPLGMQIAGKAFDEATLYRVAWAYCEEAGTTNWAARRPALD
jgi:aspartyl-tRNA(Asn)/glutamyl-tRNA(Gln) amidotransferase subunit A